MCQTVLAAGSDIHLVQTKQKEKSIELFVEEIAVITIIYTRTLQEVEKLMHAFPLSTATRVLLSTR